MKIYLSLASSLQLASATILQRYGKKVTLPFPNEPSILGVGGLSYNRDSDTWTASSENIVGSSIEDEFPITSLPRIYHMKLDFETGTVDFPEGTTPILVDPTDGLKLEDLDLAPLSQASESNETTKSARDFWVVSEAHSDLVNTIQFFSKDFGAPDLSTYDPESFTTSRLVRIDGTSGAIVETAIVPDFAQWEPQVYDWDSKMCRGDRPFQGLHAISIVPTTEQANASAPYTMVVGIQAALYQDGPTPTTFDGSATRILMYDLGEETATDRQTATFSRSFRYDTSRLTIDEFQKGARHFNALFGLLAIDETQLIVAECEDYYGFGASGHKIINRLYYVVLDPSQTVDHCSSLLDCDVGAPTKYLLYEEESYGQLDGIAWGPSVSVNGTEYLSIALSLENDDKIGLDLELFTVDLDALSTAPVWKEVDERAELLKSRTITVCVSAAVVLVLVIAQIVLVERVIRQMQPDRAVGTETMVDKLSYKHYALATSMLNSFLVGGVTFGFSGMSLMLRQEGAYASQCACGSFCASEKEQLAVVSTVGFVVAIGSRLFVGLLLDSKGPKVTAVFCNVVCFAGFLLLAVTPTAQLSSTFVYAWVLLSFGGSGMHIAGFHMTNLFSGDGKKVASAAISAAFGASSAVFPLWQVFNQYLDVSVQSMAATYTVLVFIVGCNNFLVQPWKKVQPGIPLDADGRFWLSDWWKSNNKQKPVVASTLVSLMSKFEFWGECLVYSANLLLLTHFLSTSAAFLYEKGDVPFTSEPNSWSDYIFTRMAGWFNSLGFLWYPAVKLMMLRFRWPMSYTVMIGANLIVVLLVVCVPQLQPQVAGFALLSFARLMLFSFHHAYILDKFGIEYFGLLNGVSSLVAAMVGLLSYPLQLLALQTSYSFAFIPIAAAIAVSAVFPFFLRRVPVSNWAESYAVDPRKFVWPESIQELVKLIVTSPKLRCAGAMHSCAPLVMSEGDIILFDKLNKILEIDVNNKVVRVEPGVRVHDLCEALKPHGLALGTLGTIDWQTVVGAVMTGTHGGSLTTPSLHDFVESYTLVKANGDFLTVDRDTEPKLFSAMAPCMGVFGVVVEVKMRVTVMQHLEAKMEAMPFGEAIPKFKELMRSNKYARVVVYPSLDMATIWTANPIDKPGSSGGMVTNGYINFRDEHEKAWLEEWLVASKRTGSQQKADGLLRKVLNSQLSRLNHYEGEYNHVLCKERNHGIPHADIEFGFDFSKAEDVLNTVRSWYLQESNHVPYYNFEIRTTQQDDAMMSCCHLRDTLFIDFQAKSTVSPTFFPHMEELLAPFGYRKHWAKGMCHSNPEYIVAQFPKVDEFVALMGQFDPEGKFRNEHIVLWYEKINAVLMKQQKGEPLEITETSNSNTTDSAEEENAIIEETK